MAGWNCNDAETNEWNGTIKAKKFLGDGSLLSGISVGAETDPTFQTASGAINKHIASGAIHYPVAGSNGYFQYASNAILASGALFTDGVNVGIGTASPTALLHLNSATNTYLTISSPFGSESGILFTDAGSNRWELYKGGTDDFKLYDYQGTAGVRFMVQTTTGNVGIGTTSPQNKLNLSGAISLRFDGETNGAGASTGTLTNAPAATNPNFWLPVSIAGTTRYIPCW